MITLGLKYLDLKSKRREEERLSKMTLEERKWYEEQEAFQRELEEVCDDIRRRRIEKSEDLDKMTLEERIQDYLNMCERVEKDSIKRGEKVISIDEFKKMNEGDYDEM